jgi:hypothetical protein
MTLMTIPCPKCKTLLKLHVTDTPEFVIIDEEEIPGDI